MTIVGADEIHLSGVTTDCVGTVNKVPPFKVGEFDTGDTKHYDDPRLFKPFDLLAGEAFPKAFLVVMVLAEIDNSTLPEFVSGLADALAPIVANEIAKAVGTGLVVVLGSLGAVVGAVLAVILGWLIGKMVEWIQEWWNDDVFPPFPQLIEIPSLAFKVEEDVLGKADFIGHGGTYQVRYSWKMRHV